MRTVLCHECGTEIPDDAVECPSCGATTEGQTKITKSVRPEDVQRSGPPPSTSPQSAPTDKVHVPEVPRRRDDDGR